MIVLLLVRSFNFMMTSKNSPPQLFPFTRSLQGTSRD